MIKKIVLKTGLHIGAQDDAMKIGGVDSPVMKREIYCNEDGEVGLGFDKYVVEPYIPGSSLKGKIRSLLEHYFGLHKNILDMLRDRESKFLPILQQKGVNSIDDFKNLEKKKNKTDNDKRLLEEIQQTNEYKKWNEVRQILGNPIDTKAMKYLDKDLKQKAEWIIKMFGESAGNKESEEIEIARVIFRDAFITKDIRKKLLNGFEITEVKTENSIDRITGSVNQRGGGIRNIERVVPGVEFEFEVIIRDFGIEFSEEVEFDGEKYEKEKDLFEAILEKGFKLLEEDYLGGSGSRGYGAVEIKDK